jgi:hypothetical protein
MNLDKILKLCNDELTAKDMTIDMYRKENAELLKQIRELKAKLEKAGAKNG